MSDAPDRIRALYRGGRFAEAVDYIRSLCKDVETKRGEEWRAIASAAMNLSDLTTARLAALRWRHEEPEAFEPMVLAAGACAAARDEKFALNSIDLLVRRFADQPQSWFVAGVIRGQFGAFDQAIYELKRAFSMDPSLTQAWDAIAHLKSLHAGDPDIDFIASLPDRSAGLPTLVRAGAHFAAGKAYDAVGDTARAFDHFAEGAALRRAELNHDMKLVLGLMRNAVDAFEPELFDRFRGEGAQSSEAIFLIGPPRAGTAIVEQILASHPRVYGAGEAGVVRMTTWPLSDLRPLFVNDVVKLAEQGRRPWLGLGENLATFSKELYGDHLYTVYRGPDLAPFVGVIRLMLPFAKIIFVDRNPVEAAWSAFRTNYQTHPWSFDFDEIAEWFAVYEKTRQAWRERIGGETLDVSFEALVSDPQRETRRILKFIGLSPDPACDRFFETQRLAPIESVRRLRSPMDAVSIAPSRAYGDALDPLRRALDRRGVASAVGPALH
jgi:tetratricopeptide (TPR) repeat protein